MYTHTKYGAIAMWAPQWGDHVLVVIAQCACDCCGADDDSALDLAALNKPLTYNQITTGIRIGNFGQ